MKPEEMVSQLSRWADQLETLRVQLEQAEIPRDVLEGFKRTIDNLRITLWAALSLTESDLAEGVAHFRMKRTEEMCLLVQEDIRQSRITKRNPDLLPFQAALQETLSRIETLQP